MKYLLAAALLIITQAHAQETETSETIRIAEDYLAAYSSFDMAAVAPFLSADMVFHDPTSSNENADNGPFFFEGKEAVLRGLGDYASQFKSFSVEYDIERRYESEGVVVFVAVLRWNVLTANDAKATGAAPIVTAVTVKDGKVVKHTDYYDYKGNAVSF